MKMLKDLSETKSLSERSTQNISGSWLKVMGINWGTSKCKRHMSETLGNTEKVVSYKTRHVIIPILQLLNHITSAAPVHGNNICVTVLQQHHESWKGQTLDIKKGTYFLLSVLCHWHTKSPPGYGNPDPCCHAEHCTGFTALFLFLLPFTFPPCREPLARCRTAAGTSQDHQDSLLPWGAAVHIPWWKQHFFFACNS